MGKSVEFIERPVPGPPVCGFRGRWTAPDCGASAHWHVLWSADAEGSRLSFLCDEHMERIRGEIDFRQAHHLRAPCRIPGAAWQGNRCTA